MHCVIYLFFCGGGGGGGEKAGDGQELDTIRHTEENHATQLTFLRKHVAKQLSLQALSKRSRCNLILYHISICFYNNMKKMPIGGFHLTYRHASKKIKSSTIQ